MKKILFIDRDGTIIAEPGDEQVDSLDKLEFIPGVIGALSAIMEYGYEMVLATNQDGLGTPAFPEEDFRLPHEKMLWTLSGEGVFFDDQLIDPSLPEENSLSRKPGTGMFGKYLGPEYDLPGSFVIGDRITDVLLARNLGAKAILLQPPASGREMVTAAGLEGVCALVTDDWRRIAEWLRSGARTAVVERVTSETIVRVSVDLAGQGTTSIATGLGFLDHMLWQVAHHSGMSLNISVVGDLHVDEHHTVEDTAIALGQAVMEALGSKRGVGRYGFALPMDESRALVLLDLGGRVDFNWDARFRRERVGDVPTEMFSHFFKSFAQAALCNLHISARGKNEHHKIEGIFKAFARTLRAAVRRDPFAYDIPSSKGLL